MLSTSHGVLASSQSLREIFPPPSAGSLPRPHLPALSVPEEPMLVVLRRLRVFAYDVTGSAPSGGAAFLFYTAAGRSARAGYRFTTCRQEEVKLIPTKYNLMSSASPPTVHALVIFCLILCGYGRGSFLSGLGSRILGRCPRCFKSHHLYLKSLKHNLGTRGKKKRRKKHREEKHGAIFLLISQA